MSTRSMIQTIARHGKSRRWLQTSAVRRKITNLQMPAMSPTMTEGGISHWKKKEGESFAAGDVLLEIETDKATIDVEAQDDGIMGKILAPDGTKNVSVGKVIALLAEEGDDISNLQAPQESEAKPSQSSSTTSSPQDQPPPPPQASASTATPSPKSHGEPSHSKPLLPSVLRLLQENNIDDADKIKGTGVRGMLTKGDVLTYLGKASGPLGTYQAALDKEAKAKQSEATAQKPKEVQPVALDGPSIRRLISQQMLAVSEKARAPQVPKDVSFDDILADYLPPAPQPSKPTSPSPTSPPKSSPFDGLI
ncbi:single hybrid motif-containing protein [Abortiporus biennis]|nr:single hybrid motif-containing protein [Abortiporus biennis]